MLLAPLALLIEEVVLCCLCFRAGGSRRALATRKGVGDLGRQLVEDDGGADAIADLALAEAVAGELVAAAGEEELEAGVFGRVVAAKGAGVGGILPWSRNHRLCRTTGPTVVRRT
jgi:hypothetical protein